ncbi:MAG: MgtC/SapB family protein [Halobacteriaceae archaeon]
MSDPLAPLFPGLDSTIVRVVLAGALGLFLGLEREWSQKPAGIRTFGLTCVLGAILPVADRALCAADGCLPVLTAVGGLFVVAVAAVLMYSGVDDEEAGLHLTTAVSLGVAYGVGVLAAVGALLAATVVTVGSSLLLVFKRELHGFAWGLSREELHSAVEFAILAFVVYPLLPTRVVVFEGLGLGVELEPRVVWLMVVFVAGIGIVNYAVVQTYGSRGIAVTGFFGGLASSTAVVGTMRHHVNQRAEAAAHAAAAILLADAAMAVRNLLIAVVFTLPTLDLLPLAVPLGGVIVASVAVAAFTTDWSERTPLRLGTPFSLHNAVGFGLLFLVVVVAGGVATSLFGAYGIYATALLAGVVSSAGATTSAVALYRTGALSADATVLAVVLATVASVVVKVALTATSGNREFASGVALWSGVVLAVALVGSVVALLA